MISSVLEKLSLADVEKLLMTVLSVQNSKFLDFSTVHILCSKYFILFEKVTYDLQDTDVSNTELRKECLSVKKKPDLKQFLEIFKFSLSFFSTQPVTLNHFLNNCCRILIASFVLSVPAPNFSSIVSIFTQKNSPLAFLSIFDQIFQNFIYMSLFAEVLSCQSEANSNLISDELFISSLCQSIELDVGIWRFLTQSRAESSRNFLKSSVLMCLETSYQSNSINPFCTHVLLPKFSNVLNNSTRVGFGQYLFFLFSQVLCFASQNADLITLFKSVSPETSIVSFNLPIDSRIKFADSFNPYLIRFSEVLSTFLKYLFLCAEGFSTKTHTDSSSNSLVDFVGGLDDVLLIRLQNCCKILNFIISILSLITEMEDVELLVTHSFQVFQIFSKVSQFFVGNSAVLPKTSFMPLCIELSNILLVFSNDFLPNFSLNSPKFQNHSSLIFF
ncbi:hypothetical protein GEMRC1_009541 [Eukaryota sp. GEM-RC1]